MKTFNVNSYVWIKLTKLGLRKLKERHNEIYKQCPSVGKFTPPETDADGFCKMQLWEVMNILVHVAVMVLIFHLRPTSASTTLNLRNPKSNTKFSAKKKEKLDTFYQVSSLSFFIGNLSK